MGALFEEASRDDSAHRGSFQVGTAAAVTLEAERLSTMSGSRRPELARKKFIFWRMELRRLECFTLKLQDAEQRQREWLL